MSKSITGEEAVGIASKIYGMRKAAKFLFGDKYLNKVAEYKPLLIAYMKKNKCKNELTAAIRLSSEVNKQDNSEATILLIFSAALEITEPSNPQP
jgi:hypothetical protein